MTLVILVCLASIAHTAKAQVYPIQVNAQITPPYTPFLSDYTAPGAQRMMVNFLLKDPTLPEYRGKLRITIDGVGITIRTKQGFTPSEPLILQGGGVPLMVYGEDLEEYFRPSNLDFSGITRAQYEKGAKLPEGVYRFTIEVLDYNRNTLVSNKGTAMAWVILNDPPILNLPRNENKLQILDPTNIPFAWTPRHTGSPNSAFTTEYTFRMVEVWPLNRNPYDAFLSQPTLYEVTTNLTQIVYGPAEPALLPGRRYAWQVHARDTEGRDLFKNHGKSEVYVFQFGDALGVPENLSLQTANSSALTVRWDQPEAGTEAISYRVRYRPKKRSHDAWYESTTGEQWKTLSKLQPDSEYEIQVRAEQHPQVSEYNAVKIFKTAPAGANDFACQSDVAPPPTPVPGTPVFPLSVNDTIHAGGYDVLVRAVTATGNNYTGEGFAIVPWFNSAKVRVTFKNISVNERFWLTSGEIKSVWNADSKFLLNIEKPINPANAPLAGEIPVNIVATDSLVRITGAAIGTVTKDDDGNIVVATTDGQTTVLPKGQSYSIVDDVGNGYVVDKEGNITKATATEATAAASRGERTYNIVLKFEKAGKFGFDEKKYDVLAPYYQQLENGDYVTWKAVSGTEQDKVNAVVTGSDIDVRKIAFEVGADPLMPSASGASAIELNLFGKAEGTVEELLVLYPTASDSTKKDVIGKLNLVSYDKISKNLVIVPVNDVALPAGVSASFIQKAVNETYGQGVAEWKVSIAKPLKIALSATFDDGQSGLLSNYTGDMKAVINAYGKLQDETYYLFLVDNPKSGTTALGYMPRSKQAGFIFVTNHAKNGVNIDRTISHELGHGAFNLQHTFDELPALSQGSTDNLMDYPSGHELVKYQWDHMHNPQMVLSLFEDDEDSESVVVRQMVDLEDYSNKPDGTYTFITPSGNYITLPSNVLSVMFSTLDRLFYTQDNRINTNKPSENLLPLGALSGFTFDGKAWYTARVEGGVFKGYVMAGTNEIYPKGLTPVPNPEGTQSGIALFLGIENGGFVSYVSKFQSSFTSVDLNSQDGSGGLLKDFSVVNFNADLTKGLKTFLFEYQVSDKGLKTIQNPTVYLANKDVRLEMITGDKTVGQFLEEVLDEQSPLKDYIGYFQIVNMKEKELEGLFECVGARQKLDFALVNKIVTDAINKALYGESGRLTEASQMIANIKVKTLEELVSFAKVDMSVITKVTTALKLPTTSAEDLYEILTNPYRACSFTGLEIDTRIAVLNLLLTDNDLWDYEGYNVIKDIVAATPSADRVKLLKQGFMANNYAWVSMLWKEAIGRMNGVAYEDVVDVFNIINPWIQNSFNDLGISLTLNKRLIGAGLLDFQYVEYPAGMDEFIVGAVSENEYYFVDGNHSIRVGQMDEEGDIEFTEDGNIRLRQEYSIVDRNVYLSKQGSPSPIKDYDIHYDQSLQPFEPLLIKVAANYAVLNLDAGQEMVVPAYMALVYDHDIREEISARTSRKAWNIVEISLAALLVPETGGGSLAVLANALTAAGAITAAADLAIEEEKNSLTKAQLAANANFYNRWDAFKTTVGYANMAAAGVTIGAKAIPKLSQFTRRLNVVKTWNALVDVARSKTGRAWTDLLAAGKNAGAVLTRFSKIPKNGLKILKSEGSATWIAEMAPAENKIYVNVDEIVDESLATIEKAEDVTVVYRRQNVDLLEEVGDVAIGFKNGAYCVIGNYLCFTGETPIATPNGMIRVDRIEKGMKVYSRDEITGNNSVRSVTRLMRSVTKRLIRISVAGNLLFATATHPFYANGHWQKAEHLKVGDTLVTHDNNLLVVEQVKPIDTLATVYNFEVKGDHSYFAGESAIWVHNNCLLNVVGKERFARILQWAINRGDNLEVRSQFYNDFAVKLQSLTNRQLDELIGTVIDGKATGGLFFEGTASFQNKIYDFVKTGSTESSQFWSDMVSNSNATWKHLIATHRKGVSAWEVLSDRAFRTSADNITRVSDILSTPQVIDAASLKKAIDFAATNKVHKWSGQNLIDAVYTMKDKSGIAKIISNLGSDYARYRKGAGFVLYKANQIGIDNIRAFESTDVGNNLTRVYDIILEGIPPVYVECKSWDQFYSSTITSQFFNKDLLKFRSFQDIRYFVDESLMSLDTWYDHMRAYLANKAPDLFAPNPTDDSEKILAVFKREAKVAGMDIENANDFELFLDAREAWFDIIFKQDF
ncbi:fibronectin type III domain-containing protein [Fulvivirgaceae bacterium PWU20]|uniref:Fibronectin type III domain-containing protein n=1 Tax=Chryseosolibacter indicus TaxID=2782351 RepID=A0ABS5VZG2_9BACT|nr:fibronectin type III domain-containing protein [Chryseosolibacter indicus]